jgi:electron transfer flavoprotein alpha subunit
MILAIIEHDRGIISPYSLQLLTYAHELAKGDSTNVKAVVIGNNVQVLTSELRKYSPDGIIIIEDERLENFNAEAWAGSIIQLAESKEPSIIMAAATDKGNEVLAHVGARLDLPMSAYTSAIQGGTEKKITRLRWGSSLLEETVLKGKPLLITIALNLVKAVEISGEVPIIEDFRVELNDKVFRVKLTGREEDADLGTSLTSASIVIGGGRGVGSADGFSVLEALAECIDGAVGGSRVATNNGWIPHTKQVGLTGNRIAPKLYIACGISGAVQHLVGCKGAKKIMVINNDPQAPFFTKADYGVIGDLHEILPAITRELKKNLN